MNLEKKISQLIETITHVQHVLIVAQTVCAYLFAEGQDELALDIMRRALVHDASKASAEEFYGLAEFANDLAAMTDAKAQISSQKLSAIELHWKHNRHHPEHFSHASNMSEADLIEMVIDWVARSQQYNTNVWEFYQTRRQTREAWDFEEQQIEIIEKYLHLLTT